MPTARTGLAILTGAMLLIAWVYWPGLQGPFLYDDQFNLGPVLLWDRDLMTWQEVILGNPSGMLGRPVAMLSFLISGMFGVDPFHFKLGNLLVHLACAGVAWGALRQLFALDRRLAPQADLLAAVAVALWLVHPLHASTVLYAVQRMAQLSTLFALAGLALYLRARAQFYAGLHLQGTKTMFIAVPAMLALGLFSKENAAVLPALCLLVELTFPGKPGLTPAPVRLFYLVFLILPTLALIAVLVLMPDKLLAGYALRDFSVGERLLTQPRALLDYLGQLVIPHGPSMTLYSDGYAVSTGLLSPPSTLLAIAVLSAASVAATMLRARAPLVFFGWFFFLVAHGVESGIIPLDLYYEHRNYLPSIGLTIMVVAAVAQLLLLQGRVQPSAGFTTAGAGILVAVLLLSVSAERAQAWQSKDRLIAEALQHHPDSLRARLAAVDRLRQQEQFDEGADLLDHIERRSDPRWRLIGRLERVSLECARGRGGSAAALAPVLDYARPTLDMDTVLSASMLLSISRDGRCAPLDDRILGDNLAALADAAVAQGDATYPKQQIRYAATIAYARSSLWPQALEQAQLAWQPGAPMEAGSTLLRVQLALGDLAGARTTLASMHAELRPLDRRGRREAAMANHLLLQHEAGEH